MRAPIRLTVRPARCHIFEHRLHHGLTGLLVLAGGIARCDRTAIELGVLLLLDDAHDWRVWLPDLAARTVPA